MNWLSGLRSWARSRDRGSGNSAQRTGPAQLLVDVSVIYRHDARTGIQRVVRGILLQLIAKGVSGLVVRPVFARRDQGYHYANPAFLTAPSPTAAWRALPTSPVDCRAGDVFLGLDLAAHLLPRHRGQISAWKAAGVKIHLLVYDLLPVRQPQWFQRKTVRNFKRWLRLLGRYCDNAICISQHTRQDLHAWLDRNQARRAADISMNTIRLGGDLAATGPSEGISEEIAALLTRRAARPFVMMIGTVEPRKGYEIAIQGFERLWARDGDRAPDLVLVGRPGWKTEALQRHIRSHVSASQKLFWLDDASDELLDRLYRECCGVIVPAYAEGFGLPVDEASRYGKPVLARDLTVFREAGRPAISFFRDDLAFADALSRWTVTLPRTDVPVFEPCGWDTTHADLVRALGADQTTSRGDCS